MNSMVRLAGRLGDALEYRLRRIARRWRTEIGEDRKSPNLVLGRKVFQA